VEDSGCGIPEGNIQRIFEPLFTTKAKGIGLGLSITRSILAMNHGSISARSRVGKGSIFTVVLKRALDVC
jgi:signal transduction histidine kinase